MSKEYIEREKALEKVIEVKHYDPELSGVVLHRYIKEIDLKDIPAADVVEVVRCRECKHSYRIDGAKEEYDCAKISAFAKFFPGDHFCSYGERKTDVENLTICMSNDNIIKNFGNYCETTKSICWGAKCKVEIATMEIPKTGDMPLWVEILNFLGIEL